MLFTSTLVHGLHLRCLHLWLCCTLRLNLLHLLWILRMLGLLLSCRRLLFTSGLGKLRSIAADVLAKHIHLVLF